jgi:hypothetical protein
MESFYYSNAPAYCDKESMTRQKSFMAAVAADARLGVPAEAEGLQEVAACSPHVKVSRAA